MLVEFSDGVLASVELLEVDADTAVLQMLSIAPSAKQTLRHGYGASFRRVNQDCSGCRNVCPDQYAMR